ncbi:MAG: N-acetylmuramoyl-L-alanine amidase [Gemmatimonadaceae bacterium]|nr:N-acetylmuramoyl-L-alanine amidase [Gemmatimonadaceae bacterium]
MTPHRCAVRAAAAVLLLACRTNEPRLPEVDGPLAIDVVFPTPGTAVPINDSIAIWGSIGTGRGALRANGTELHVRSNGAFAGIVSVPPNGLAEIRLEARRGDSSLVRQVPLVRQPEAPLPPADSALAHRLRWVRVRRLPSDTADSATQWRPVYSRWRPGGIVGVPLPQGFVARSDAARPGWLRLRLAEDEAVWIPAADADTTVLRGVDVQAISAPSLSVDTEGIRLSIPIASALPTAVEHARDHLRWTLYGVTWRRGAVAVPGDGHLVLRAVPIQGARGRVYVDVPLAAVARGWRTEYSNGAMHLVVRQQLPPADSLRGLRVVLDPGHPPDGSTGPSGLREDSVTLAVALRAAERLRAAGAIVTLTRHSDVAVSLEARAAIADRASADAFLSIHVNAPAAGRAPERVDGTTVFWQHAPGMVLARAMAPEVAHALGYEHGSNTRGDYAVLRSAWMPAVLIEGTTLVLPEREDFLRTSEGVDAWAEGIVRGLLRWRRGPGAASKAGARAGTSR